MILSNGIFLPIKIILETVKRWQNHYTNRNENQSNKEEEDLKGEKLGGWRGRLLTTNLDRERGGTAHYDDRDNHDRAAAAHYDDPMMMVPPQVARSEPSLIVISF